MSFRRFLTLVRCLSPQSATVSKLQSTEFIGAKRNAVVTVEGAQNVDRAFDSLFRK